MRSISQGDGRANDEGTRGCVQPAREALVAYAGPERFAALSLRLFADMDTPISVYRKLSAGLSNSFLLESVEGGELMGRYSFIGCGVDESFTFANGEGVVRRGGETRRVAVADPLDVIQDRLAHWSVWANPDLPRFLGGAVGYLSFDCVRYFEDVPLPSDEGLGLPEGILLFPDELAIYDHLRHQLTLVVHVPLTGDRVAAFEGGLRRIEALVERLRSSPAEAESPWLVDGEGTTPLSVTPNRSQADMEAAVAQAQDAIGAGEVFQVVPSQRLTVRESVDPVVLYRSLRALNPSPYMFLFDFADFAVVGASPEVLVRLDGDELMLRPIAGTRPRGDTREADLAMEHELLACEKELAEHRMLVDLGRNDLGRVATVGSVRVERPMHVERYSHVMHMVTDVRATIRPTKTAFDAFRACFPAGTVSGAPKVRACELLAELEPDRRGLYAGAVGYFDVNGNMDTCIAIRTLVVERDAVHVQAGAGVVYDSVPQREHEECLGKASACLKAVECALHRGAEFTPPSHSTERAAPFAHSS